MWYTNVTEVFIMGVFEKSIPKYVINPINQQVEVAPKDVYVDDIFDPIFNANVRNAMRQKYGGGLYGTLGGYSELLKNTWNGDGGMFGKGMGFLSTFGRSMDKAGDILLGTLTEGVEGLSGQGFDNPFSEIFVEDKDYSGKRLLASTANVLSPLVGGTRITEDDLGTMWNVPGLAVDLATDPGILGSGLARKFAPTAKNFTSKELFQNLGKSDVKTTVGEIGQLMSNYDDLMAKVAISAAAPGLRTAFKKFRNRIAQAFKTHSSEPFENFSKEHTEPSAAPGSDAPKDPFTESSNALANELLVMYKNVKDVEETIPFDADELEHMDLRTPSQVKQEVVNNMPSYWLENKFLMPPEEVRAGSRTNYIQARKDAFSKKLNELFLSRDMDLGNAIAAMLEEARMRGIVVDEVGIDRRTGYVTEDLNEIRRIIADTFLKEYYNHSSAVPVKPTKVVPNPYEKHQVYDNMFDALGVFENPSALESASEFLKHPTKQSIKQWRERYPTLDKHLDEYTANQSDWRKYFDSLKRSSEPGLSLNRSYIDDVIDVLSDDAKLLEALESRHWSDNEAVSNTINAFLSDPKYKDFQYYKTFNKDITVSPSLISNFAHASGEEGLKYSDFLLDNARYANVEDGSAYFETPEDFDKFFDSDEANALLNSAFPPFDEDLDSAVQINSINKFKRLLKNAYYPAADISGFDRMQNLQELSDFVNSRASWVRDDLTLAAPSQARFLEHLIPTMESIDAEYLRKLSPIKNKDAFASGDVSLVEYLQALLSQIAPQIGNPEALAAIVKPLKPFAQVSIKENGKIPVSEALYASSKDIAKSFYFDAYPIIDEYLAHGGNPFPKSGNVPFKPYTFSDSKYKKLLDVLGYSKTPHKYAPQFKSIVGDLIIKGKDVPEFDGKYKDLSYKRPKRGTKGNLFLETVHMDSSSANVRFQVLSPTDLVKAVNYPGTSLHESIKYAIHSGQNTAPVLEQLDNVAAQLRKTLSDVGISSEEELKRLLDKAKINDGPEAYRKHFYDLTLFEQRKLNAYILEYEKLIKQVPFRIISRNPADWIPENMHRGFGSYIEALYNSGEISASVRGRLQSLLARENAVNAHRYGYSFDEIRPTPFGSRFKEFKDLQSVDRDVRRKSLLSTVQFGGKTLTPIEFKNVLSAFKRAEYEDVLRFKQFEEKELPIKQYAESKGKKYSPPKFDKSLKQRAYAQSLGMSLDDLRTFIDEYATAERADFDFAQFLRDFETDNLQRYPYTDKTRAYVEKHLVSKLPYKFRVSWDPSLEKGLFHTDMRLGETAKAMYIGDSFDIIEGDFQRNLRYGKGGYRDLINYKIPGKSGKTYKPFVQYLDHSMLQSKKGFDKLAKHLANESMYMNYYSDTRSKAIPITNTVANVAKSFDEFSINTETVSDAVDRIETAIVKSDPSDIAEQAYVIPSTATTIADEVIEEAVGDIQKYLNGGGTSESAKRIYGKRSWTLFEKLNDARAIPRRNSTLEGRATLRTSQAKSLAKEFNKVRSNTTPEEWKRFAQLTTLKRGDVVSGDTFWKEFRESGGEFIVAFEKGSAQASNTLRSLKHNADVLNSLAGYDIVEVVESAMNDGSPYYIMRWTDAKGNSDKLIPTLRKIHKKLDTAKFEDIVFLNPREYTPEEFKFMNSENIREMSNAFENLQRLAADQYKFLGFDYAGDSTYIKHVMRHDIDTATWINRNLHGTISSEEFDDIARLISNFDDYRKTSKGTFGTSIQSRRFRGAFWNLENPDSPLFTFDPVDVFNSTLGEGVFANSKYQTFTDLFINDNFKIKGYFNTVDDLKDVLYMKTPDGNLSGNFQNLDLVSYKVDSTGKLTGLKFYDKASDAGLSAALADENTILIPANAVSNLDNTLRKDIRYSNKAWSFVNKYFTVPFKIGLLSNPSFILGNISDATMKIITDMSEKYGTTITEETANITECINATVHLKNNYATVFEDWLKTADEFGIKLSPESRVADIVSMSPKHRKLFMQYLNGTLTVKVKNPETGIFEDVPISAHLSKKEREETYAYLLLQELQIDSSRLREFADAADLSRSTRFDVSGNVADRIIRGKRKYNAKKPSSWGLFMNNPITEGFSKASGVTEDIARTSAILDDLRHQGISFEDMAKHFEDYDNTSSEHLNFGAKLDEAKNTMFHSQFDYERVNDTYDNIGKAMPFPIFFLKNLHFWLELFDKHPQYVDNVISVQEGLWDGYNEDEDEFKTEAKGRGAIPVGGDPLPEFFKGIYKPSPLQSMFSAFNLLNNPVDDLTYRVNPIIGGAATTAAHILPDTDLTTLLQNPDNVKYRPYSFDMYERNIKFGDPEFNPLEYTLHRMNPIDRSLNTHLRLPDKLREGDAQVSDVLPSVFQPMF